MSVEYHDSFRKGETWTIAVALTDADGAALVPDDATWTLTDWGGTDVVTKTIGNGITLQDNIAAIIVPTVETDGLLERLHRHELVIVKDGAISREIHGTIGVLP